MAIVHARPPRSSRSAIRHLQITSEAAHRRVHNAAEALRVLIETVQAQTKPRTPPVIPPAAMAHLVSAETALRHARAILAATIDAADPD